MTPSSPPRAAPTADPRRWLALALLAVAQFVVVLDASIMNIALPSISADLGVPAENLSWIINAYVLTFGGFLLLGGRMGDLLGRRRIFVGGLVLFSAASFAGGLSQSEGQLVAARAIQGLGAALLAPAALSIVTTLFPSGTERNQALAVWGAVAGAGGIAGVLLGGVLTSALGWESVLLVNVPIGLITGALAFRLIDESRVTATDRSFDLPGAAAVTAGLSAAVFAIVEANSAGWGSVQTLGLLGLSGVLLGAFVAIERRATAPLVPFGVFRLPMIAGANATMLAAGGAMFGLFFFLSIYMQEVLSYSALTAGLTQLPLAGMLVVAAGVASPLMSRVGFRPVLVAGLSLFTVGLVWFSRLPVDGTFLADILGPSLPVGAGLGMAFVALTGASVDRASEREAGLVSGLINTSQQIGGALGLAVLAAIATARTESATATAAGNDAALTAGLQTGLLASAGIGGIAIVLAVLLVRSPARSTATTPIVHTDVDVPVAA